MLPEALRVVEAARSLDPRKGTLGIYALSCGPVEYPSRVRELADAIQGFDKATGTSAEPAALLARLVGHLSARGEDVPALLESLGIRSPRSARSAVDVAELVPQPGELGAPDTAQDLTVSRQASEHGAASLGGDVELAPRWERHDPTFPSGDPGPEPMDPTSVRRDGPEPDDDGPAPPPDDDAPRSDIGIVLAVEERLKALGEKYGWTPKLRSLDGIWRHALKAMEDAGRGGSAAYLVTPETLSALMEVATEVAAIEAGADPDPDLDLEGTPAAGFAR